MYDVIAKVPAADFDFVEYNFVEFWARKNMVVMNIEKLDQLKLDFNMAEYQGSYTFDLTFKTAYGAYIDGKYVISDEKLVDMIRTEFDLRPAGIIKMLDLRRPIYRPTAAYGHFGRNDLDLPWEKTDKSEVLKNYLV